MARITVTVEINAPPEVVWKALQETMANFKASVEAEQG